MGEITVEEPKTVVDEVTRYECDKCGYVGTSEEFSGFKLFDDTNVHKQDGHLCDECTEKDRYVTYMDLQRDKKRIANLIDLSFDPFIFGLGMAVAYGIYAGYNSIISTPQNAAPNQVVTWSLIHWGGFIFIGGFSTLLVLLMSMPFYNSLSDKFTCLQS